MGEAEERVTGWFAGRIPQDWFEGPPEIAVDREEILIVGRLADVEAGKDATDAQRAEARSGRIKQFREDTRERRMRIAREAEHRFRRKVSWGTECGDERELFTTLSLPMMTRLRMPERQVLDTLGMAYAYNGNFPVAREFYEQSIRYKEGFGDQAGIAISPNHKMTATKIRPSTPPSSDFDEELLGRAAKAPAASPAGATASTPRATRCACAHRFRLSPRSRPSADTAARKRFHHFADSSWGPVVMASKGAMPSLARPRTWS